ncbi:MAG: ArsC/Spx/MgsR family protein [Ilumatobacteraceae bacterium]
MGIVEELGADVDIVNYSKTPPDEATLRAILAKLEDPHTDLVRRDSLFKKLDLTDGDVATDDQIVDVLLAHKMLMQRPVVVTADRAIIGRPKERIRELLGG